MDPEKGSMPSSQRQSQNVSPQSNLLASAPLPGAPTDTDKPKMQMSNSAKPKFHFSEFFWGENDRGLDVLVARMKAAKHTTEDIISMLQTRANIEEEYSKKLMKLHKQVLGKNETGTLKQCLDIVHQEIEMSAKAHYTVASDLRVEAEKPFQDFLGEQLIRRRAHQANAERALKSKVLQQVQVQKTKEKYEQKFIDNQNLLATANSGNTKEAEKARSKLEKGMQQLKLADSEYKRSVETLQELTRKWEEDFTAFCEECETLEMSRHEQTRSFLWNYTNVVSVGCVAVDESSERVRVALEQCNAAQDIEESCTETGTGRERPKPQQYIKLGQSQSSNRDSLQSSLASIPNGATASNASLALAGQNAAAAGGYMPPQASQSNRLSSNSYMAPQAAAQQPLYTSMNNMSLNNGYSQYSQQPQLSQPAQAAVPAAVAMESTSSSLPQPDEEEEFEDYDVWDVNDATPILFKVRVLYQYAAQAPEELTITPGEILDITAQQSDGWWESIQWVPDPATNGQTKKRRKGLLPSNFVEVYS